MAWMFSNPQVHNTFASLGTRHGDMFTVSEDCLSILEEILRKLASEDSTLRTFRRAICFGQNIRKDLIPLLLYIKDDTKIADATKIIDTTIKILVNLTIPVEYLLSLEALSRTDVGKHTIFELNKLLITSKEAFTDSRSTKAVMDHIKYVVEKDSHLNIEQCDSINNCLLLLRNILHIPENRTTIFNSPMTHSSMQNQILWNLFTQSIDKIIIYLMSCPQKMYWGVTLVQLIALMYKDQHVGTLQKLLNLWLEASLSESSEDNESNTSPPDQGSGESSPTITSDPTSDSSDNGGSGKSNDRSNNTNVNKSINSTTERNKNNANDIMWTAQNRSKQFVGMKRNKSTETENSTNSSGISSMGQSIDSVTSSKSQTSALSEKLDHQLPGSQMESSTGKKRECPSSQSEVSDCGYATQVENQESISTSSNDDDHPHQKPVHQKPHTFQKSRYKDGKNRATTALEKKELRRKKLVKRSKTNTINMKGLMHHLPTDEDISNILKEFTVDFLLKGYGTLVQDLHSELLTNIHIQIDTSHFFWLVTYFLKFATQLELDLEHISPVLSFDILSYLIFQGLCVYEEFEISCRIPNIDLKPCLRRLHLVVTAIREFLQTIDTYQKMIHLTEEDHKNLLTLQFQICQIEELRCLFVLLLRQYNINIQSKQYLQDLILTNHNYLLFLDNTSKLTNRQTINIMEHLKQFATVEIMRQYGLLLESFKENGEFVNNCIFTMMHHIGGDLSNVPTLFQPSILKTFSQIWETDFEICDDWSDLIEYVIHKFINTPRSTHCPSVNSPTSPIKKELNKELENYIVNSSTNVGSPVSKITEWTKEDKHNLLNYYNQSLGMDDAIGNILKKYEKCGMRNKTQLSIIRQLFDQNIINDKQYNILMKNQPSEKQDSVDKEFEAMESPITRKNQEQLIDGDIRLLKEYLVKENKGNLISWLQKNLIEACFVKLVLTHPEEFIMTEYIMEPTTYYFTLLNLPMPVVPWTVEQNNILKYQPFILLLHKLGLYLPVDTGKIFVRIPNFWNADYIFSIAQQLGPINTEKLKFDINLLHGMKKNEVSKVEQTSICGTTGYGKFSTNDLKQTPSIARYTPLPNSTKWFQTVLPVMDTIMQIPSTSQLSIEIPEMESVSCNVPPPEFGIANDEENLPSRSGLPSPMQIDCSPLHSKLLPLHDEIERNSICDTASVTSDLTRMCVSDEEDKDVVLVIQEKVS